MHESPGVVQWRIVKNSVINGLEIGAELEADQLRIVMRLLDEWGGEFVNVLDAARGSLTRFAELSAAEFLPRSSVNRCAFEMTHHAARNRCEALLFHRLSR